MIKKFFKKILLNKNTSLNMDFIAAFLLISSYAIEDYSKTLMMIFMTSAYLIFILSLIADIIYRNRLKNNPNNDEPNENF
ncbi:MAG: hypothetical protein LBH55_04335 [Mycoplasmataceae bacterium]|jgi:hypothetical protein|nr:hypothetical protein [Mycoplasmataceae bacterium]